MVDHQALAGLMARFACSERRVGFGDYWEERAPFLYGGPENYFYSLLFLLLVPIFDGML